MLPYRLNARIFTATLIAGCFLATFAFGQAQLELVADPQTQQEDYSVGSKFKLGAATIDLSRKSTSDWFELRLDPSKTREDVQDATFTLDFSGQDKSGLFPESLNLTTRKTDFFGQPQLTIGSPGQRDPDDWSESDYIVSVDWGAPENRFTFSFSSRFLSDKPHNGDSIDEVDDMLNFTQTLQTDNWQSSFTASVGRGYREEAGTRERSNRIGASASFRTMHRDAPHFDFTARVIQDRSINLTPGTRDIDTKWELRTGSNLLGGVNRDNLTIQPSLSIFFSVKGNSPDAEEQDIDPIDVSAGVAGKVHF